MAYGNGNTPWGLRAWGSLSAAPFNASFFQIFPIASQYNAAVGGTNPNALANGIFSGDPVCMGADGTIKLAQASVEPAIATLGTNSAIMGVFVGCTYIDPNTSDTRYGAWINGTVVKVGTVARAMVLVDPNVIYDIQSNNAGGVPATSEFDNANWAYGAGNAQINQSGVTLGNQFAGSIVNSNNYPLKIWNYVQAGAQVSTSPYSQYVNSGWSIAYNNLLVSINTHALRAGTVGGTGA
jgi:hypothetical protein